MQSDNLTNSNPIKTLLYKMSKLPLSVRVTDAVHRVFVLGLFGITAVGTGSILFNIYANSDFGGMNKNKLKFSREEFDEKRANEAEDKQ
ncbi:hypothetical protein CJI97_004882 [Candidozyma auris]|uniref:Uncharacterized protein n=2 Tax=Candidozyma auris TaxID=498019 RepID=A0A2H0ZG06_CANAR|nr:hypothetical protein QG37_03762 [[Candida] auris]PIS49546.1 hypothetical protein B9J08_004570 [[Candida] auris]PIS50192.1 hypothetical protein CJI97_004882 [[Candida] auris]PSK77287.1 hypothetical protein CJJ07_002839 [[Candida] auris]QEL62407.1 hypothetical protein CJJ09_004583 [[Candida] auris]